MNSNKAYYLQTVFPNKNDWHNEKDVVTTVWDISIKSTYQSVTRYGSSIVGEIQEGVIFYRGKFVPVWRRVERDVRGNTLQSKKYHFWKFDVSRKV